MIITTTAIIPIENINAIEKSLYTNDIIYYIKGRDEIIKEHFSSSLKLDNRFQELITLMTKEKER